ncbi:hypothetical protein Baya_16477 [Bagarius yarrelli]|uniref:Uncharacterized protein n=1 Tax=Bagarius yarrelli TaxID=175774 RepID=A0A556VVS8_BAGYA|nr:hypothetical protein Baya_16477 [Bagarius yarrelli]
MKSVRMKSERMKSVRMKSERMRSVRIKSEMMKSERMNSERMKCEDKECKDGEWWLNRICPMAVPVPGPSPASDLPRKVLTPQSSVLQIIITRGWILIDQLLTARVGGARETYEIYQPW